MYPNQVPHRPQPEPWNSYQTGYDDLQPGVQRPPLGRPPFRGPPLPYWPNNQNSDWQPQNPFQIQQNFRRRSYFAGLIVGQYVRALQFQRHQQQYLDQHQLYQRQMNPNPDK